MLFQFTVEIDGPDGAPIRGYRRRTGDFFTCDEDPLALIDLLAAKAQARYDELKRISAKGGSTLMSNSTFEYVAESATEGQFAFFKGVLDNEFELRRASRIARLKRGADFPFQKSFDGFEWDGIGFPNGFTREDMLSLGFVDRHEDLVLFGGSGNGKSHTAVAWGYSRAGWARGSGSRRPRGW